MKKFKWFWMTLGAWCFIASVSAWALIFSPFHFGSQAISKFPVEVNGVQTQNLFSVGQSSLPLSLVTLIHQWKEEGWNEMTGRLNLATALLNIPKQYNNSLDHLVQIKVFQKKDAFRLLGLWYNAQECRTYQWVSDWPKKTLEPQDPARVDFPFKPPLGAFDVFVLKTEKMKVCFWSEKSTVSPIETFSRFYANQGFSGRLLSKQKGEAAFVLRKGSNRLLAVVRQEGNKMTISLLTLAKIV